MHQLPKFAIHSKSKKDSKNDSKNDSKRLIFKLLNPHLQPESILETIKKIKERFLVVLEGKLFNLTGNKTRKLNARLSTVFVKGT